MVERVQKYGIKELDNYKVYQTFKMTSLVQKGLFRPVQPEEEEEDGYKEK
jgi:hypothetical protein